MSYPFRVALLEDAYKTYEGLVAQGDKSVAVRQQMADVLHKIAGVERDLNHNAKAEELLERSAAEYQSLVVDDPNPPAVREALGIVLADLAYTWQFDFEAPNRNEAAIEATYRAALATFEGIEREYPGRPQPVALTLRSLADIAYRRGDHAEAEKLWKASISRGEAFLKREPANNDKRSDLTWACVEYYDAFLDHHPQRADEAKAMIELGLKHVAIMREHNPLSTQATDVTASLHFRQALLACGQKNYDQAIPLLHESIRDIQQLCTSYPWVPDYWNTAQWVHLESIGQLRQADRPEEIAALTQQTVTWLSALAEKDSIDFDHRKRIESFRAAIVNLLETHGYTGEASELKSVAISK
jgi:tetratricopeptide (TPR) repeat protein